MIMYFLHNLFDQAIPSDSLYWFVFDTDEISDKRGDDVQSEPDEYE